MIDLLIAIKEQLQADVEGVRDVDIFLSPDLGIIPEYVGFPAIGIKDGKVSRTELIDDLTEVSLPVEIGVYDRMLKDESAIRTVHATAKSVRTSLADNYLDGYVKSISRPNETPVILLVRKDALILRKVLSYEYEKEE